VIDRIARTPGTGVEADRIPLQAARVVGEDIDEGVRSDLYARLFTQGVIVHLMTLAIEMVPVARAI